MATLSNSSHPMLRKSLLLAAIAIALIAFVPTATAAAFYWDTSGNPTDATYGGTGTWDTTNTFWNDSPTIGSGTALTAWNNAASPLDTANFLRPTTDTVTVSGTVLALATTLGSSTGSFTAGNGAVTLTGGTLDLRQTVFGSDSITNSSGINTINSAITLWATGSIVGTKITSGGGSLTINGGISDGAGLAIAHTFTMSSFSGGILDIAGNITKAGTTGITLNIGTAGTANSGVFALGGNNTGLTGVATLNRGTLTLNNANALSGASGLTVANANAGAADTASLLIGTAGVTISKNITYNTLGTDTTDIRIIGGSNTTGTTTYSGTITLGAFAASGTGSSLQVTAASGGTTVFSNTLNDSTASVAITKVGLGTVNFNRNSGNTYDGGTTIAAGTLLVTNLTNSGTGTGAVNVNVGTLGGTGFVSGAVTIGNGAGTLDSFIAAGSNGIGTFTTSGALSLASDATFSFELNSNLGTSDKLVANGVTLNTTSVFSFVDLGSGTLALNTAFTIIDNTSLAAISGSFSNLANLSTFTVGANQFEANYAGGTGNDLVITVVPEPVTWALLTGAGTFFMLIRRRII